MTLNDFIDIWTRKKHIVYLCPDRFYDDMFDLIDEINDGEKEIKEIFDFTICAFIPTSFDFIVKYYIKDKFADAEVVYFYVGDGYMIVWISVSEDMKGGDNN